MTARRRIEALEQRARRPADSGPDALAELTARLDALRERFPADTPPATLAEVKAGIDTLLARSDRQEKGPCALRALADRLEALQVVCP